MNLSQPFRNIASGLVVQIRTLEVNKHYPVLFARRLTKRYGSAVQLTLQSEEDLNIKIYLPKRYADAVDDTDIEDINLGRKTYKLIYKGRTGSAYIIHLEL